MTEEDKKPKEIEIIKVNRNNENWDPISQLYQFLLRVVLTPEPSMIKTINRTYELKKRLQQEAGLEGRDWVIKNILESDREEDEIYLRSASFLVKWRLTNSEEYKNYISKIEEHDDSIK